MWNSDISTDSNNDDQGAFVHLVNENTSWHGHTMMAIEYNCVPHTYWGLSFQPANEGEGMTGLLVTGVPATLINRTSYGQTTPGIWGVYSSNILSYVITQKQKTDLEEINKPGTKRYSEWNGYLRYDRQTNLRTLPEREARYLLFLGSSRSAGSGYHILWLDRDPPVFNGAGDNILVWERKTLARR